MCKIPVVLLADKKVKEEIELSEFNPDKHQLLGEKIQVTISQRAFHELSKTLKAFIGGCLNMSFGKVLRAIDPGSAYPVYQIEVKNGNELSRHWLPKIACELHTPTLSSIRKSLGALPAPAVAVFQRAKLQMKLPPAKAQSEPRLVPGLPGRYGSNSRSFPDSRR